MIPEQAARDRTVRCEKPDKQAQLPKMPKWYSMGHRALVWAEGKSCLIVKMDIRHHCTKMYIHDHRHT
jgi:hypothetical protein